ncbi:hypothetical protein BC830DRAFT_1129438 [Chytriomyces sp. MP71]|nr:hypothetical protein BC830DRAFT_1129438 [Chytriomyces sp. MP71]
MGGRSATSGPRTPTTTCVPPRTSGASGKGAGAASVKGARGRRGAAGLGLGQGAGQGAGQRAGQQTDLLEFFSAIGGRPASSLDPKNKTAQGQDKAPAIPQHSSHSSPSHTQHTHKKRGIVLANLDKKPLLSVKLPSAPTLTFTPTLAATTPVMSAPPGTPLNKATTDVPLPAPSAILKQGNDDDEDALASMSPLMRAFALSRKRKRLENASLIDGSLSSARLSTPSAPRTPSSLRTIAVSQRTPKTPTGRKSFLLSSATSPTSPAFIFGAETATSSSSPSDSKQAVFSNDQLMTASSVSVSPVMTHSGNLTTAGIAQALPFPMHLQLLQKFFSALESTLAFHASRDTPSTFHRILKPVQNMCNRTFTQVHLAQICALLPGVYRLTPVRTLVDTDTGRHEDGCLIEMLVLDYAMGFAPGFGTGSRDSSAPTQESDTPMLTSVPTKEENAKEKPFAETLEKRRDAFARACVRYVDRHHQAFLKTLSNNESDDQDDTLPVWLVNAVPATHWHPQFDVETVPPVVGIEIPTMRSMAIADKLAKEKEKEALDAVGSESVEGDSSIISDSGNVSVNAGTMSAGSTKLPAASLSVCDESGASGSGKGCVGGDQSVNNGEIPALCQEPPKKLSRAAALLERIREKEKKRNETEKAAPKYTPAEIKKRAMISRLPEVARSMMSYFAACKKGSLAMKEVCEYVMTGVRSFISYEEARDHIMLLTDICPEWCSVVKLQVGMVVKVDASVLDKIPVLQGKVKGLLVASPTSSIAVGN